MKKLFITLLLAALVFAGAFAAPPKVNPAILYNFRNSFKEASMLHGL